ncbi:MAG: heparinase II/III-family protein [Opitutaceae bacterium]|nr:heparinase II/III-family protein [Opitutaceae bacterium]
MVNLLHTPVPESEIAAILARTAGRPSPPPLGAPEWTAARDHPAITAWFGPLRARAEAERLEPLPALTDELYSFYHREGVRLPFERPYFERRRRLGRAALCLLLDDGSERARLLPAFLQKFTAVADEESWALPSHVGGQPSGKDPWVLDLFAAETAHQLAELLVVFAKVIPVELAARVRSRLRATIFENYLSPRVPLHWATCAHNWNAVCHQGILGAALAIEEDHALVARMLATAARGLPAFLGGFGADGSTSEGPGYWGYGFGWFTELNARLEHRTDGALSFFHDDPKIAAIARFAPALSFSGGQFVNFSDSSRTGRLKPALLAYLGERLGDSALTAQAAALYRHTAEAGLELDELRCDFFQLTRLVLRTPAAETVAYAAEPVPADAVFPDYGALVARGRDARGHLWEFAAKAGHNAEHHNHNDCGSFLLNLDGAPALVEIGAPEYVRGFFGEHRYTYLAARSLGHSVPFVNGREQAAGRHFAATVREARVGGDVVRFSADLAHAYPTEAGIRTLLREIILEKTAGRLSVTDTCELADSGAFETLLITESPVTLEGDDALLATPRAKLRVAPAPGTRLLGVETLPYRGHQGTDEQIHRLRLGPTDASATARHRLGYVVTVA